MQSAITESIKGHLSALQTLMLGTGSLALLLIWAAFQNDGVVKLFGVDSDREKVYLTAGLFLSASNLVQALYFLRLSALMRMASGEDAEKTFYSITLYPSLMNPFSVCALRTDLIGFVLPPFVSFLGLACLWSIRLPYEDVHLLAVFLLLGFCGGVMVVAMLKTYRSLADLTALIHPSPSIPMQGTVVALIVGGVFGSLGVIKVLDWLYYYS
ncbi:hypothetical protein [Rhizobium ruizarguesonis]|uniref:ABC transporter permease n=1 Tax=Rhizobium ruizarguesonis TaxID=2081791 RepID=A0ABY1X951_9HYPH|nr:hypothetical protein [Rhizobium ruizarguesonis]TAX81443.1 hypothetical protein ELH98_10440 [Rhizobium ruizarguesonis]